MTREAELIRALAEDLALEILTWYTAEDFGTPFCRWRRSAEPMATWPVNSGWAFETRRIHVFHASLAFVIEPALQSLRGECHFGSVSASKTCRI